MIMLSHISKIRPVGGRVDELFSSTAFLLGVALPTSMFLLNVSLILIVICLLIGKETQHIRTVLSHPLMYIPVLMFLLLVFSLLYHDNAYATVMIGKYVKWLYILPLALFFLHNRQLVPLFCRGFLLANAVVLAVSLLVGVFHLPIGHISPSNPTVFKLHITQNFFMALSALCWLSLAARSTGWQRRGYGLLTVLASYSVLFLVLGRTGYVALVTGAAVWLSLALNRRQKWFAMFLALVALCILALVPNRATDRMIKGIKEVQQYVIAAEDSVDDVCSSSMGLRAQFVSESIRLIKSAPLLGHGAGGFYYGNHDICYSVNPHNEYLMQTVQSGLVGLSLFLIWIACCYRVAWQQPVVVRNGLIALLSCYVVGNLFNSFLLDATESYLFMILVAILVCYSHIQQKE